MPGGISLCCLVLVVLREVLKWVVWLRADRCYIVGVVLLLVFFYCLCSLVLVVLSELLKWVVWVWAALMVVIGVLSANECYSGGGVDGGGGEGISLCVLPTLAFRDAKRSNLEGCTACG